MMAIEQQGYQAFQDDESLIRNPYVRESLEFEQWKKGWMHAWWKAGEGDWR